MQNSSCFYSYKKIQKVEVNMVEVVLFSVVNSASPIAELGRLEGEVNYSFLSLLLFSVDSHRSSVPSHPSY